MTEEKANITLGRLRLVRLKLNGYDKEAGVLFGRATFRNERAQLLYATPDVQAILHAPAFYPFERTYYLLARPLYVRGRKIAYLVQRVLARPMPPIFAFYCARFYVRDRIDRWRWRRNEHQDN